jgi:hypothetical protein
MAQFSSGSKSVADRSSVAIENRTNGGRSHFVQKTLFVVSTRSVVPTEALFCNIAERRSVENARRKETWVNVYRMELPHNCARAP